ncbi:uncharacterized protein LOC123525930 [Mercenaria mercenaria]|uniref:uncharacterized protein LOC123525930 n=1 Tax=Mercenaria mercenaria TaxID=6596 RepID=UPI00234E5989|nr:uncharacterized protein LOC123525930 [Mercenaria mercenaria]
MDSVHGRHGAAGSDKLGEWCVSCKTDGHEIIATGFCKDCEEYMCNECWNVHCKPRKMRGHAIVPVGKEDKEEHQFTKSGKIITMCTDKCPVHQEKFIEYFCHTHEQLCCTACNVINHKTCSDVVYIPDVVSGLTESEEILKLTKKLEAVGNSLVYNKACIKTNLKASKEINKDAKKQNATLQRELFERIEKKKTELDSEADRIFDNDSKKMNQLEKTCAGVMGELDEITAKLNDIKESGQLCQLFVTMKGAKISAGLLEDKVHEIELTNNVQRYAYKPNAKCVDLKNTLDSIGELVPEHSQKSLVSHCTDIDLAFVGDKSNTKCFISGLSIISQKHIVATDMENNSAKLIDTTQNKLVYTLLLQSAPRDITKVTDEEVVLTLPESKMLQFLSVSTEGKLKSKREVSVGGQCYGIVCNRKELFVSFIPSIFIQSSKIKVLDFDGQVLKTLTQKLLGSPGYLALSNDQSTLYVSDWGNSTVTSVSMEGKVIATYYAEELKMPHGLVCTRGGSVYVCGRQSKNIHQLSANCEKVQVLSDVVNGSAEPFSVAFSDKEHKLYIGLDNRVSIFSVI